MQMRDEDTRIQAASSTGGMFVRIGGNGGWDFAVCLDSRPSSVEDEMMGERV